MNHFYIHYSVIDLYGIGNFSVIYFLARSSFSVIDLFQNTCESKRFDVYLRGLKTCEDYELKYGDIGIQIIFNM